MFTGLSRVQWMGCVLVTIASAGIFSGAKAYGQDQPGAAKVIMEAKHDTTGKPLRSMEPTVSLAAGFVKKPYRPNPHATVSLAPPKRDPLLQNTVTPSPSSGPAPKATPKKSTKAAPSASSQLVKTTVGKSFDGIGAGFTGPGGTFPVASAPPDTNGAVGQRICAVGQHLAGCLRQEHRAGTARAHSREYYLAGIRR